jgi:hypothetical protein
MLEKLNSFFKLHFKRSSSSWFRTQALGQSNFLLFVFGLFFILISSIVVLLVLDLWFLMFFLPRAYFRVFSSSKINRSSIVVFRV